MSRRLVKVYLTSHVFPEIDIHSQEKFSGGLGALRITAPDLGASNSR